MKNRCCKCGLSIDSWDFYVQSREGNICSSCLVAQDALDEDIRALFKTAPSRKTALAALREMPQAELETEPLILARSSG
ncbi:hypothetical protein SAMN02745704_02324 [Paucidesulfovibrio gracilis DSM 16080]|uniref:Uncharacterized protein n=1 Tax=Paucidesulfovibrio gracilis DSM 16080 TaxID=1121449 RepID=A0A1T4XP85_9BACT|nr:hypothetical protein [Paucidesulfovibrio gracilis]SKA91366.1 hypothetical protein SAMN02745704_02324 [Paucidesulfovibrio gracilis DSM 16080]